MDVNRIGELLATLEGELRSRGETNWIRGIVAARRALEQPNGVDLARSIYATMTEGPNSFADYNVWHDNFDLRVKLNAELDRLKKALWTELEL